MRETTRCLSETSSLHSNSWSKSTFTFQISCSLILPLWTQILSFRSFRGFSGLKKKKIKYLNFRAKNPYFISFFLQTKIHILFLLLESKYFGNKDFWRENSKYFYFEIFWILFLKIGTISKRWSVDRKTKILLLQIVVGGLTNSNFALFAPGRAAYHSDSLRSCFYEFHPHAIVLLVLIWTNVDEIWDFHQEGKLLKGLLVWPFFP